jgi:hypothetical protein
MCKGDLHESIIGEIDYVLESENIKSEYNFFIESLNQRVKLLSNIKEKLVSNGNLYSRFIDRRNQKSEIDYLYNICNASLLDKIKDQLKNINEEDKSNLISDLEYHIKLLKLIISYCNNESINLKEKMANLKIKIINQLIKQLCNDYADIIIKQRQTINNEYFDFNYEKIKIEKM